MNFKRIQWIFFLAFLLFDIIIACSLLVEKRFIITNTQGSSSAVILKEMKNDSISFNNLSSKKGTGFYISGKRSTNNGELEEKSSKLRGQDTHFSNNSLVSDFNAGIGINPSSPNVRLDRVVNNNRQITLGSHYTYNPFLSTKRTIVYTQMVEGKPVMSTDGQIRFHVSANNEVTGYTQTYLESAKPLRPATNTISQKTAVIWLYKHNQIPNNSRIEWAKLGYTRLLTTNTQDLNVYIPTWVIEIKTKNSGAVERTSINAFNSTIMKGTATSVDTEALNQE